MPRPSFSVGALCNFKKKPERTYKPGPVIRQSGLATIHLRPRLPATSSGLPESRSEPDRLCSLFGLAPGGVYQAKRVTPFAGALLPHHFTLTCEAASSQ